MTFLALVRSLACSAEGCCVSSALYLHSFRLWRAELKWAADDKLNSIQTSDALSTKKQQTDENRWRNTSVSSSLTAHRVPSLLISFLPRAVVACSSFVEWKRKITSNGLSKSLSICVIYDCNCFSLAFFLFSLFHSVSLFCFKYFPCSIRLTIFYTESTQQRAKKRWAEQIKSAALTQRQLNVIAKASECIFAFQASVCTTSLNVSSFLP